MPSRIFGIELATKNSPVVTVACCRWGAGLALLPAGIERVRKFSDEYGTDDPGGEQLVKAILAHAAADDPTAVVVVALRGDRVVGHYAVTIETWAQVKMLTIVQFELDEAIPISRMREEIERIETWGRLHGCTGIQVLARSEALVRVYRTFYGFSFHATCLRRSFAAVGNGEGEAPAPSPENGGDQCQAAGPQ